MTDVAHWRERLDAIERDCQQENWNSYNADPVAAVAIEKVRKLAERMDVTPTVTGGVTLSFANESIQIEFDYEGRISNVWVDIHDAEEWLMT